jgi:transposase
MQMKSLQLKTWAVGALPVIDGYLAKLDLHTFLLEALGRRAYTEAIELLVKNILVQPNALYRVREWSARYEPSRVFGGKIGDDTLGRALERLFDADRASLMTRLVVAAIKKFDLDTSQIHNDSTSVTFCGAYAHQNRRAVALKRGHNKDHRPDLLQLVYSLSITADGAVPVHFKTYDGNQTDDGTHWETWQTLRGILGRSDFLYVADAKLCVSKTLLDIDRAQGHFVTILPRTRAEAGEFSEQVFQSMVRWERIYSKRSSRKRKRLDVFELATGLYQMREGFRLYWYRSSEKTRRDEQDRIDRLSAAHDRLQLLNAPGRRGRKTEAALRKAANKILVRFHVEDWIAITVNSETVEKFKQTKRGAHTEKTVYHRLLKKVARVTWTLNQQAIDRAQAMDGIFPLVTNTQLSALEVLHAYKYQPKIEKRHSLFKSVLEIAPVFLKKNERIDALIFVYFVAQLVAALIERSVRTKMAEQKIESLPVLPENRPSKFPTAEQILHAFEHRNKHELQNHGVFIKTFADPLSRLQKQLLSMLDVAPSCYL